jgi:hypothetical protein
LWRAPTPERRAEIESLIGAGGQPPPPGAAPAGDEAEPADIGDMPTPLHLAPSPAAQAPADPAARS